MLTESDDLIITLNWLLALYKQQKKQKQSIKSVRYFKRDIFKDQLTNYNNITVYNFHWLNK